MSFSKALFCIFLFSSTSFALPSVVQVAHTGTVGGGQNTVVATFPGSTNVTAGHSVAVMCWTTNSSSCTAPTTSPSETWTGPAACVGNSSSGTNNIWVKCYYTLSAVGGWSSITCNMASSGGVGCTAWEFTCPGCTYQTSNLLFDVTTNLTSLGAGGTANAANAIILFYTSREDTSGVGGTTLSGGSWVTDVTDNSSVIEQAGAHYINPPLSNQQVTITYSAAMGKTASASMIFSPAAATGHKYVLGGGFF